MFLDLIWGVTRSKTAPKLYFGSKLCKITILLYWKCYLVVLDQISYDRNAFEWVKKITQNMTRIFEWYEHDLHEVAHIRLEMCQRLIRAWILGNFRIFFTFHRTKNIFILDGFEKFWMF